MNSSSPEPDPLSTATSPGADTDAHAFDRAEAALLDGRFDDIKGLLAQFPECPPLDPDEGRDGRLELELLATVLRKQPLQALDVPAAPIRLGYALLGQPGDPSDVEARAWPAFAAALARGARGVELAERFPDLWMLDLPLWRAFHADKAPVELARRWLQAPGRRLLIDLSALAVAGAPAAKRLSAWEMLTAAGGDDAPPDNNPDTLKSWLTAGPSGWRTLQAAIPGASIEHWTPLDGSVVEALRTLEGDDPLDRAAAIHWLIDYARTRRHYRVGQIVADLRGELPVRLSAALSDRHTSAPLAMVTLRHAAHIADRSDRPMTTRQLWCIARWLGALLIRSPFFGGDAEALTARLSALLPSDPTPDGRDVLAPAHLESAHLPAIAFLGAVSRLAAVPHLGGLPVPIIDRLVEIADGEVGGADRDDAPDGLGWLAQTRHADPALAARRLCTDLDVGWLGRVDPSAVRDTLGRLEANPTRFAWVAEALFKQRQSISEAITAHGAQVWRTLTEQEDISHQTRVLLAVGVLGALEPDEQLIVVKEASTAEADWRPWLLGAVAEHSEHEIVRATALDLLLVTMADVTLEAGARLNAALVALRRISALEGKARTPWQERFMQRVNAPPHRGHVGLARELIRLGWKAAR